MVIETGTSSGISYAVIDAIIYKHNIQPGAVIPVLQEIQDEYGYVPHQAVQRVAESMNIRSSEVYGIVTFYSQFRLEPVGKNIVKVCHGTACHLNGAERVADAIAQATGAKEGETSADGLFTVEKVACLGCCSLAPCVMCNNEVHGRLTPDDVNKVISPLKGSKVASLAE